MPTEKLFEVTNNSVSTQPSSKNIASSDGSITFDVNVGKKVSSFKQKVSPDADEEKIEIDSIDSVSKILLAHSLNANKPEIIAMVDFLATNHISEKTPASRLLDTQFMARSLKTDDVSSLISDLSSDPIASIALTKAIDAYNSLTKDTKRDLKLFSVIYQNLASAKKTLDIKDNTNQIAASVSKLRNSRGRSKINSTIQPTPPGVLRTLRDILVCHLLFSDDAYESMSNTKVLSQLIIGLRSVVSNSSPRLFNEFVPSRAEDRDPVNIAKSIEASSDFSFEPKDLASFPVNNVSRRQGRSTRNPALFNPNKQSNYNSFVESLPVLEKDRIKLLITLLSKELRISAGIARLINTDIGRKFAVENSGQLIENIFGSTGEKITGEVPTDGTLSSLVRYEDPATDGVILPFETREVDDPSDNRRYLPGNTALIDSILDSAITPNLLPITRLNQRASSIASSNIAMINYLMNFDSTDNTLHSERVVTEIFNVASEISKSLGTLGSVDRTSAITTALIRAARDDSKLRHLLFKYTKEIRTGKVTVTKVVDASDENTGNEETGGTSDDPVENKNIETNTASDLGTKDYVKDLEDLVEDTKNDKPLEKFDPEDKSKGKAGANPTNKSDENSIEEAKINESTGEVEGVISSNSFPFEIEKRVMALFNSNRRGRRPDNSKLLLDVSDGDIESILNKGVEDFSSIFNAISSLTDSLTSDALTLSSRGPSSSSSSTGHKTENGATRFRKYTDDTVLMIVFEIFSAMISEFVSADFGPNPKNSTPLTISLILKQNKTIADKMTAVSSNDERQLETSSYSTLTSLLDSIFKATVLEDNITRDLVDMLYSITEGIKKKTDSAVIFFENNNNDPASQRVNEIINDETLKSALANLTPQQIALSWQSFNETLLTPDKSLISKSQITSNSQKIALDSMLRESRFEETAANNMKLMVVGLPAGTLNKLQNPIFTVGKNTELESSLADLITVKVFKRDPEFSEIIFKPLNFIFDMSRFTQINENLSSRNKTFTRLLDDDFKLKNIDGKGIGQSLLQSDIKSEKEYSILTQEEQEELFENHVVDSILKTYLKLLTGLDFSESSFVANEGQDVTISQEITELLTQISVTPSQSFTSLQKTDSVSGAQGILESIKQGATISKTLTTDYDFIATKPPIGEKVTTGQNPNTSKINKKIKSEPKSASVSSSAKKFQTQKQNVTRVVQSTEAARQFKRFLNSLIFRSADQANKTMQPKLFERTFILPVDPDDFIIDEEATLNTETGREAFNSLLLNSCVIEEKDKFGNRIKKITPRKKSEGSYEFSEIFAVVELGASS